MRHRRCAAIVVLLGIAGCTTYYETAYSPTTQFAPSYSEEAFAAVQVGTKRNAVVQRCGPPLREFDEFGITFLVYSDIGRYTRRSEKAFRQRWLALDSSERVVYTFNRTITTDHDPLYPVLTEEKGRDGVFVRVPGPDYPLPNPRLQRTGFARR